MILPTPEQPVGGSSTAAGIQSPSANRDSSVASRSCRQRKLMFVIEALTIGGAEHMVVDLANEFVTRGDVVHAVCLTSAGEIADQLSSDVALHILHKKPGVDLSLPGRLRALVKKLDIDVVNSHLWTANLWTRIALLRSGVPVVITEHNRDEWKGFHNRIIDRLLSHTTARLIAVSQDTAEFYKTNVGVSDKLVTVVNNGVDTRKYASGNGQALRRELASADEFLIGSVGRLATAKNHLRLIEATGLLRKAGVPVQLVIAGEGPERAATEAMIARLGLQACVSLLGERKDIPDLLAALDVFVLSSDREGHPLSALEAQAAGTPVVLTDAGGSADAISRDRDGEGGILVDKSAAALAACLTEIAEQPDRLAAMSSFARHYAAKHFDKVHMIDRYSVIFDEERQMPASLPV